MKEQNLKAIREINDINDFSTPKNQRCFLEHTIQFQQDENIKNNYYNDYPTQMVQNLLLKTCLAVANLHNEEKLDHCIEKAKIAIKEYNKISYLEDKAKYQFNEDNGKEDLIPRSNPKLEKIQDENNQLRKEVEKELSLMKNEAMLYQKYQDIKNSNSKYKIEEIEELYVGIQKGIFRKKEINTERIEFNYPNMIKRMEKAIISKNNEMRMSKQGITR